MQLHGTVAPGWEAVRQVFEENFARRAEVGAAVCVWHDGAVVADLWGGSADPDAGRPWTADTPAVVFSTTKGWVATCFMTLVDRGLIDLDLPVARYWPGFAANGKEHVTVRQLLNHRSGLSAVETPLTLQDFQDPARITAALEAQRPLWRPGCDQGYGATAWGMYAGELFRRVAGRSLGRWLADEIAGPLGAEVWLGLPDREQGRVARLFPAERRELVGRMLPQALGRQTTEGRLVRRLLFARNSVARKAFLNPDMGPRRFDVMNEALWRRVELPWMGGVGTARGVARVYAALAGGGSVDGVRIVDEDTLARYLAVETWSGCDRVLQKPLGFTLGFTKDEPHLLSPFPEAFGHTGVGGSVGFADPVRRLAFGYVMNRLDWRIRSPRCIALCHAAYRCLGVEMAP